MSIAKLKQLFKQEQWQECAALAKQMLSKNDADKGALLMLAQVQIKMSELGEAQQTLNQLYALLNNSSDDALFYAYMTQEKLALRMCEEPGKNSKKQGRQILLKNKFQLLDWLDKMKRFEPMLKEAENYCLLLLEDENYKMIEDTYLWLMNHEGLPPEVRAAYGARIFEIDQFYNPYSRLDNLFPRLVRMKPPADSLSKMATKMVDFLEKQNSKKTLASVFQGNADSNVQSYREFCEQIMLAGQFAFTSTDAIFKNKSSLRMFARYLGCVASTTLFGSEDWLQFEARIETLLKTQYCTSTFGDLEQNPIQLYLLAFLEVSRFLREARIPDFSELRVAEFPAAKLVEGLEALSQDYQEYSFYVNAYYSLVAVSGGNALRIDPLSVQQKLNQASFLHRKALFFKLTGNKERSSPDLQVYLNCAVLRLQLPREQFIQNLAQADATFEKNKNHLSKAICEMHQAATADLRWQQSFSEGKWLEAIEILDQLAQRPEKVNFATVMKAKIQVYYLHQICTEAERDVFLQGIMNCLQGCASVEAENLLLQGYLLWTYPELFKSDPKQALQKWLQALKKDQTNYEIYFSLAVYYFSIQDAKRAIGCLEKARKLQPDFEDALVLQYYLTPGRSDRLNLIDQFLAVNKNLAVTYFLKGLIMQETQDYFQAIESYQNAVKFYNIQLSKPVTSQRLLPRVDLPIYQNPFGIYGEAGAANCWVYQSECFMKIDKPQVALKCFMQGAEKIASLQLKTEAQNTPEVQRILSILDIERLRATEEEKTEEPLLETIESLQPNKWALECLLLGSHLVSNPITSISILRVALQCQPNQGMLAFTVTQLLSAMTQLVEQSVVYEHGQVQMLTDADRLIERLDMLLEFVASRPDFMQYQNLQRRRLNAQFIMAQRLQDKERHLQAMQTASSLYESSDENVWSSLILDYAKIIHEYERYDDSDAALQTKKIKLIRQAIQKDPNNAGLWVHLHIFSKDEATRGRAIFQAYALDPQDNFVQENILKFYLSTKQWQKAFSIIVRSYQRAADQNEPQMPIILATLAYFNAMCYFQSGQKEKLLEALSLIRLVQREDMKQLMSEIYIYLSYYKGDYGVALDFLKSRPQNDQVDLMMLKALFGTSEIAYEDLITRSEQLQSAKQMLTQVVAVDSLTDDELRANCQKHLEAFCGNPAHEAPFLQLYQELCLKRSVKVEANLLDLPQIKQALQKVTQREQRTLLVQSLRLLQKRDGLVKEVQAIADQPNQQIPESEQSYTQFLIEAGRLKPQSLSIAQHKALLRLYLESRADPDLLEGPFKDSKNVSLAAKIQGLKIILRQKSEAASSGAQLVEETPLCVKANTKHLWSLLRDGRVGDARSALVELKQKIESAEVTGKPGPQLHQIEAFIEGQNDQLPTRLKLICDLLRGLSGMEKPCEQALLSTIACRLVNIVQRTRENQQQEMVQLVFKVMASTLFQQGHHTTYINLAKDLLSFTTVVQTLEHTQNLIWHNQLLTVGSALLQAKKTMQVVPLCKEIDTVARKGAVRRDTVAAGLLRARTQLALKNYSTAQQALNIDESSLERDILQALSFYANQDYKEYYLVCLGLVAGAKTSSSVDAWLLAYVYYLKAFAELTFLQAKRKGIKLKDDFSQEDSQTYDSDFFSRKAKTSLEKCVAKLEKAAEGGWLTEAASELMGQI